MLKERKVEVVEGLKQDFGATESLFVAHYHGLNVEQISDLRSKMREGGFKFFVMKNTLLKLGTADSKFASLSEKFHGPVAVATSNDPISTAKILVQFAKDNEKLQLVGAQVFGKEIDGEGIKTLSKMPSLDELRGKLISILQTPARSLVSVLAAPASGMVRVVSAYSTSKAN